MQTFTKSSWSLQMVVGWGGADKESVAEAAGDLPEVILKPIRPQGNNKTDLWWPQLPSGPTELEPLHWALVSAW